MLNRLSRRRLLVGGLSLIASSSIAAAADGEGLFKAMRDQARRRKPLDSIADENDLATEEEYFDPELLRKSEPQAKVVHIVESSKLNFEIRAIH